MSKSSMTLTRVHSGEEEAINSMLHRAYLAASRCLSRPKAFHGERTLDGFLAFLKQHTNLKVV